MGELILGNSAPIFTDTPVASGLETLINAQLAPLLSHFILGIGFTSADQVRNLGNELRLTVSYETGGTTITNPYKIKGFQAVTISDLVTQVAAWMAANPTYFFSPLFLQQVTGPRRKQPIVALVVYNESLADGEANWLAGGNPGGATPGGAAGGDLSGTYPNPNVFAGQLSSTPGATATVLDSVSAATYKAMKWSIEAIKGTATWYSEISAAHDGTTPVWTEGNVELAPGGGTFDFTNSVDISGGLLRLITTPSSTGWTFRVRQLTRLAA
jgi:hypothetical protein